MKLTESIRLNKTEQEELRKKSISINRKLVEKGRAPLRESEIIHLILEKKIKEVEVSENGDIEVN